MAATSVTGVATARIRHLRNVQSAAHNRAVGSPSGVSQLLGDFVDNTSSVYWARADDVQWPRTDGNQ
jgi:hypothetical protein